MEDRVRIKIIPNPQLYFLMSTELDIVGSEATELENMLVANPVGYAEYIQRELTSFLQGRSMTAITITSSNRNIKTTPSLMYEVVGSIERRTIPTYIYSVNAKVICGAILKLGTVSPETVITADDVRWVLEFSKQRTITRHLFLTFGGF